MANGFASTTEPSDVRAQPDARPQHAAAIPSGALLFLFAGCPGMWRDTSLRVAVDVGPPAGIIFVPFATSGAQPLQGKIPRQGLVFLAVGIGPENLNFPSVLRGRLDGFSVCHGAAFH